MLCDKDLITNGKNSILVGLKKVIIVSEPCGIFCAIGELNYLTG